MSLLVAGAVYTVVGRRDDALQILAELEAIAARSYSSAGAVTLLHCLLGNLDESVRWAETRD